MEDKSIVMKKESSQMTLGSILKSLSESLQTRFKCTVEIVQTPSSKSVAIISFRNHENERERLLEVLVCNDDTFMFMEYPYISIYPEDMNVMVNAMERCITVMNILNLKPRTDSL